MYRLITDEFMNYFLKQSELGDSEIKVVQINWGYSHPIKICKLCLWQKNNICHKKQFLW